MTKPEDALVELRAKLRRKSPMFPVMGGGSIGKDAGGKITTTSYVTDDGLRLVNPDGPEAADAITTLLERERILTAALERIASDRFGVKYESHRAVSLERRDIARAALTWEGE